MSGEVTAQLVQLVSAAFVLARLDYCNSVVADLARSAISWHSTTPDTDTSIDCDSPDIGAVECQLY